MNGWYFVLGFISWQILTMVFLAARKEIQDYRMKRFVRIVQVRFPENIGITFIAVESSDKAALAAMMADLRERFDIPDTPYDFESDQAPREGG